MQLPCRLNEAKGAVDYMISWPLSSPVNAFRAGREYNRPAAVLGAVLGVPAIVVMFFIGPFMAAWNWYTAE